MASPTKKTENRRAAKRAKHLKNRQKRMRKATAKK